jgi:hypothetical protein
MVKVYNLVCFFVLLVFFSCSLFVALVLPVRAQGTVTYSVNKEWMKVWINTDSSVNVLYNITFAYVSGSPQGYFDVGMPKGGFQVGYAENLSDAPLQFRDASYGSNYAVEVTLKKPIILNQPITFLLYATVPGMVYSDNTMNPGNDGMQFFPSTFDANAVGSIGDLRVQFVLPPGVRTDEVKYPTGLQFDRVFNDTADNYRTAVYWNRTGWSPIVQFLPGVSFPAKYVSTPFDILPLVGGVVFLIFVLLVAGIFVAKRGQIGAYMKSAYESPQISIEALGANRSLTAVEAGLVMGLKPTRVLTMMLYGLLLKRMVTVVETDPLLKLQKAEGQPASAPRYYEVDYLQAIKPDGRLDEKALAHTYQNLVSQVNQKLRGYSREDTANYYKSIIDKAWTQVTQAGTPELKGDAFNKNLDWLLADDKFDDHIRTAFPPTVIIYPNPVWWWYWGGPALRPSRQKTPLPAPTQGAPLPGQDFANNIVRGLQSTSNNMVRDMQAFANALVTFAAAPREGAVTGRPSCACACHACACACACVSCACACAGGGGR